MQRLQQWGRDRGEPRGRPPALPVPQLRCEWPQCSVSPAGLPRGARLLTSAAPPWAASPRRPCPALRERSPVRTGPWPPREPGVHHGGAQCGSSCTPHPQPRREPPGAGQLPQEAGPPQLTQPGGGQVLWAPLRPFPHTRRPGLDLKPDPREPPPPPLIADKHEIPARCRAPHRQTPHAQGLTPGDGHGVCKSSSRCEPEVPTSETEPVPDPKSQKVEAKTTISDARLGQQQRKPHVGPGEPVPGVRAPRAFGVPSQGSCPSLVKVR